MTATASPLSSAILHRRSLKLADSKISNMFG
jgi:hypothetical protein